MTSVAAARAVVALKELLVPAKCRTNRNTVLMSSTLVAICPGHLGSKPIFLARA